MGRVAGEYHEKLADPDECAPRGVNRRDGLPPADVSPRRLLTCSIDECGAVWFEEQTWDSVRGEVVSLDHDGTCRRARIAGWTGDDRTTCLCGNRDLRCPGHGRAPGQAG